MDSRLMNSVRVVSPITKQKLTKNSQHNKQLNRNIEGCDSPLLVLKGVDLLSRYITANGEMAAILNEGDRILRKKSIDYLDETVEWGKDWSFVKFYSSELNKVCKKISSGAASLLMALAPYVSYNSGLLAHNNGYPLSNSDIENLTGMSDTTITKLTKELVDNKVLFRGRTGKSYQYYANPYIMSRGNRINKTLTSMFKNYK